MFESIFNTTTASTSISIINAVIIIAVSMALGILISLTYLQTTKKGSMNFSLTLILLPTIIAIIILLIGSNVARAFSLAGAFSIIRFRSAPGNPKDITYVLFAMAAGLACGAGLMGYAILFTVILCVAMMFLNVIHYGSPKISGKLLQITIPEDLDYEGVFDDIFEIYTTQAELKKVKTAALGSLYQLVYTVVLREGAKTKDFMDTLRCRNGNLNISLSLCEEDVEY